MEATTNDRADMVRTLTILGLVFGLLAWQGVHARVDDELLTIHTAADVAQRRAALIDFVWGASGMPSDKMPSVTHNVSSPVSGLQNLRRVDALRIDMDAGERSVAYHLIPNRYNGDLVIVHHGHDCTFDDEPILADIGPGMRRTIQGLLLDGYGVLAVHMPHATPEDCLLIRHSTLFGDPRYAPATGHPLKYFLEPVAVSLNYLETSAGFAAYQRFHMVGLSGGGWTTTVYAAIDPRISVSIPVAGSTPLFNRSDSALGDEEQIHEPFYRLAGYLDLYVLGSSGNARKQIWVLNRRDTCCFGERADMFQDKYGRTWEQAMRDHEGLIRATLENVGAGGSFRLQIDDAAPGHMISWHALVDTILQELSGRSFIGASSSTHAYVRGLNGNLWHSSSTTAPEDTGCAMVGVAEALEEVIHPLDVFYRDESNRLAHAFRTGSGWTCEPIGPPIISDPAVVLSPVGTLYLFAFGTDYRLYRWRWSDGGFGAAEQVSREQGLGKPAVAVTRTSEVHVFFRGFDRALRHVTASSVFPWVAESLGANVSSSPTAVVMPNGTLRVYATVDGNELWEGSRRPGTTTWEWSSVTARTGWQMVRGNPSASLSGASVVVRARTPGDGLATFTYQNSAWSFTDHGAVITGSPASLPDATFVRGSGGGLWQHTGSGWARWGGPFE